MKKLYLLTFVLIGVYLVSCKTDSSEINKPASASTEAAKPSVKWSKEDRIDLAMEQEFYMTKDPATNTVPRERLQVARAYMNSLISNASFRTNSISWQERGPNNYGGRTRALIIDVRDATGNTLFAGGVGGGIWKCTNFKTGSPAWTPVADNMSNLAVTALAQDPSDPNTIYAGTGEGFFNSDAIRGDGVWKSTDGGVSWNQLAATNTTATKDFEYVQDIVITSGGIVYVAARSGTYCNNGGILRSANGGTAWTRVVGTYDGSNSCNGAVNFRGADLEIAANGDLYATTGYQANTTQNQGRIFRSPVSLGVNQGTTGNWNEITPTGSWRRIEIACAPSDAAVVYAALQGTGNGIGALKKSVDNGATWTDMTLPTRCSQGSSGLTDFTGGQAWYDLIIQVNPTNKDEVYVGGIDLHRSSDAGTTWTQISQWASGCGTLPYVHADQHNLIFYPSSATEVISTNDGGVFYSVNAGTSWTEKTFDYRTIQFYAVDLHPSNVNYFLGGSQDNGTHKFTTAGINSTTKPSGGDGGFCHIDQTDGQIQMTSFYNNQYTYSRNGGNSFASVPGGSTTTGRFINPTDYDDAADVLYGAHNADNMLVITNINGTGSPVMNTVSLPSLAGTQISAVKVDPNAAGGTVWVAGSGSGVPVLLKLSNAHTLSPSVDVNTILSLGNGAYVSSIDVEQGNANHILITVSNYGATMQSVLESTNGGSSFVNIEGNLPDMPVRWGIFAPSTTYLTGTTTGGGILIATEMGVWATSQTNGTSTTWVPQNSNLPPTRIDMLKYRASDNLLAAATHGRGLWTTNLPTTSTAVNPVANTQGFIQYISSSSNQLYIRTGNLTTKNIEIQLFDMNGKLVMKQKTGYNSQSLNIASLSRGGYVVKIYGDKRERYTQQFVK